MDWMFKDCSSLKSINLSSFDTSQVRFMDSMFKNCSSLTSLDLSNFNTSMIGVKDSNGYFGETACMFEGCSSLTSLDLSNFDTSNMRSLTSMFKGCSSLKSLDVAGFDTSNVRTMSSMFEGCSSLTSLDLSNFDTSKIGVADSYIIYGSIESMFDDCSSLRVVSLGEKFNFCGAGTERICSLPTPSGGALTGKWVSSIDGKAYAADAIPNNVAATYTAEGYTIDISSAAVEVVGGPFTYSGKAVEPDVAVTINGKKLVKDTDYKVTFSNNVNAGTATVTVEGIGAYGGTAKKAFQIAKADPSYTVPTGIWADSSQTLADVKLPSGFAWQDAATTSVGAAGTHTFKAVYMPSDTANYNVVRDIEVAVTVTEEVRFSDVAYDDPGCWYADGVTFCSSRGLIMGYSGTDLFGVGDSLTRAQLAAILWRCAEPDTANAYEGAASNETGMSDVGADEWYTAAANWAVANGVVNGFDDPDGRHFRPYDFVTMEQLATILANYIDMAGAEAADQSVLSSFTDQDTISAWARGSVAWAKQNGLVSGYDNHDGTRTLNPQESVARERVAVVLMNAYNSGVLK